jgi:hypothetical protein
VCILGWLSLPKQNNQALKQGVYVKGQDYVCVAQKVDATTFCRIRKWLMTALQEKGTRAGALELKSQISNFPLP